MRTHTGDRPDGCTTCGNAFSTSGSLTTRLRDRGLLHRHDGRTRDPYTTVGLQGYLAHKKTPTPL